VVAATVRTQVMRSVSPRSWATIITLRTNGERGDQCSFMLTSTETGLNGDAIGALTTTAALAFCLMAGG
jgi:hypothetical protein